MEIENSSPLELVKFLQLEMDHKSTATDKHGDSWNRHHWSQLVMIQYGFARVTF